MLLFAAVATANAWFDTGHMVVAAIAQKNLTPTAKAEADRLLKVGSTEKAYDFITAGPWADDVKTKENGPWHYYDIYFREDGNPTSLKPDEENALTAIDKFSKILGDKSKPDSERADALRFLIHIVGDIHQPLHAVSRVTETEPKGDRGGNGFKIEAPAALAGESRPPKNLHSLWDSGLGLFPSERRPLSKTSLEHIEGMAKAFTEAYPPSSIPGIGDQNPEHWVQQSFNLAKTVVYAFPEGTAPSDDYMKHGQEVAKRQVALAGYRLAALLNRVLK